MKKNIFFLTIVFLVMVFGNACTKKNSVNNADIKIPNGKIGIEYFGQSMFRITSPVGFLVVIDPFKTQTVGDWVLVTHNHFDHDKVELVANSSKIFRAIDEGGNRLDNFDSRKDVSIKTALETYHDANKGAARGKNGVFLVETGGVRMVHLGDVGETLSPQEVRELGKVDILFVPVGGKYTVNATKAKKIVDAVKPKVVIPMHYAFSGNTEIGLNPPQEFISLFSDVKKIAGTKIAFTKSDLPANTQVWFFEGIK